MPKPIQGINGSGMHTHQSLFRGKDNAFYDPKARVPALQGRAELHRGAAAARARLLRDHQPADQQLQAAGAGLRGAGQRGVVHAEPLAAGPHSRPPRARHALRAPHARSVVQSRTSRSRCSSPPGLDGVERKLEAREPVHRNIFTHELPRPAEVPDRRAPARPARGAGACSRRTT